MRARRRKPRWQLLEGEVAVVGDAIVVTPETTVLAAAQRMRESNLGFLPVCTEDGALVGVLTDRDVVHRMSALWLGCAARGALEEQRALAPVLRERGGALELATRLVEASELGEKIGAHRRQEVVAR